MQLVLQPGVINSVKLFTLNELALKIAEKMQRTENSYKMLFIWKDAKPYKQVVT